MAAPPAAARAAPPAVARRHHRRQRGRHHRRHHRRQRGRHHRRQRRRHHGGSAGGTGGSAGSTGGSAGGAGGSLDRRAPPPRCPRPAGDWMGYPGVEDLSQVNKSPGCGNGSGGDREPAWKSFDTAGIPIPPATRARAATASAATSSSCRRTTIRTRSTRSSSAARPACRQLRPSRPIDFASVTDATGGVDPDLADRRAWRHAGGQLRLLRRQGSELDRVPLPREVPRRRSARSSATTRTRCSSRATAAAAGTRT